jgi:hypothetical protein
MPDESEVVAQDRERGRELACMSSRTVDDPEKASFLTLQS